MSGINSIPGILAGHYTDLRAITGCTALVIPEGAVAGVEVRGAAPATRETDLLSPLATVDRIHGLLLTGGSAFGLEAAGGVMDFLESQGIGYRFGESIVPVVPAAALFDLAIGDGRVRPGRQAGYLAAQAAFNSAAGAPLLEGSVGAGTGATVGKIFGMACASKGGLGCFCHQFPSGERIGALAVVNAFGDILDPGAGQRIAGCRRSDGATAESALLAGDAGALLEAGQSTTLIVVATDAALDKARCAQLARMAHDGLARAVVPAHTPVDGDLVFALSTGSSRGLVPLIALGAAASFCAAQAILRGVRLASGLGGVPGLADGSP